MVAFILTREIAKVLFPVAYGQYTALTAPWVVFGGLLIIFSWVYPGYWTKANGNEIGGTMLCGWVLIPVACLVAWSEYQAYLSRAGALQQTPAVAQLGTGLEPKCAADIGENASACWMELSNRPGCYIWNFSPQVGETVTWSGGCAGGKPSGEGWVRRTVDGDVQEGPYVDGMRHGQWVLRFANGDVAEGPVVDDKRHGQWVQRFADGEIHEGPFVDGKQHGQWVLRYADGGVQEGPFVDSKRHGQWVERFADGDVQEGPYVDGMRHGQWVVRTADGRVQEGSFVEGKQHGQWKILTGADK